jgi:hypothetical protein
VPRYTATTLKVRMKPIMSGRVIEWLSSTPNAEGDKVETESVPPTARTFQFDHEIDNPNHFT